MIIYLADSMADVYLVLRTYWFPVHLLPSTTAILSPPEFWVSKVLCQGSQARWPRNARSRLLLRLQAQMPTCPTSLFFWPLLLSSLGRFCPPACLLARPLQRALAEPSQPDHVPRHLRPCPLSLPTVPIHGARFWPHPCPPVSTVKEQWSHGQSWGAGSWGANLGFHSSWRC